MDRLENISRPAFLATVLLIAGLAFAHQQQNYPVGAQVQSCGATSTCSHSTLASAQVVMGSAPLVSGTPSAVTITGISPPFTSTSTYFCVQTDETTTASALVTFSKVSGSSFTITGPATNTDTISYVCVGN